MYDAPDNDPYASFRFAADVQPQPNYWLWPARIPLGKLTLLIGDPGVGKSLLAADLAARVSAPHPWPDSPPSLRASVPPCLPPGPRTLNSTHLGGVILACPEDSTAETLLPRLTAAHANLASICILEGATETYVPYLTGVPQTLNPEPSLHPPPSLLPLTLPNHIRVLQQAIRAVDMPRLVILDPLQALISPHTHRSLDTLVASLAKTAYTYGVAIVAVGHLNKPRSQPILYRVRGSLTLIAAARAAHLLSADPDDPDRRILSPIKTLYGPPPPPIAFRISPGPRLEWETPLVRESPLAPTPAGIPSGPWNLPADLLHLSPDAHSTLSEACDWLLHYLAAGPRPASVVLRAAHAVGFSTATLRRAKRILAVPSFRPDGEPVWLWSYPQRPYNQGAKK